MADFGLVKSFDIDHGELDGLRPQECFVLGYELALIDEMVKRPDGFCRPVHANNRERIEKACCDAGRRFALTWMNGDVSESWMQLQVEPSATLMEELLAKTGYKPCSKCGAKAHVNHNGLCWLCENE